jgi:serine/threonine protein kinase
MKTDPIAHRCPKCAAPLPDDAPQGLCPKCLLVAAATPTETGAGPAGPANVPALEAVQAAFPQLELIELIGAGGMGAVFKARQPKLDRFVALKLLSPSLAASPAFAERFNREARVLARLSHPGIVNVFDFGQAGDFFFLLMEFVDGVNLRQAMQAGRFTPAQALALVPKICEALQFAHDEGILHRDIKPENILLDTRGRMKIADFGIAKLVSEPRAVTKLTATGAAIGTPQYMAPEQIEHPEDVDQRADIYSLGVVFYEMLTGELPIGRFAAPSEKSSVDARVDAVVFRTLEKERERRYGSAGEVKTSVEHLTTAPAASRVAAPAFDPAKDFILCPPQLPRMAKAIIVYALTVAPVVWLLSLFTIEPLPDHALVGFVQAMVNVLTYGLDFLLLIALAIGGWKLRGLRASAINWLRTAIWLRIGCGLLAIGGVIWVEMLAAQWIPDAPVPRPHLGEGLVIAFALAAMVFEISVLVWLHRHRLALRALCAAAHNPPAPTPRPQTAYSASADLNSPPPGSTKRGRLSWAFVGLGCLGLALLAGVVGVLAVVSWISLRPDAPAVASLRPYPNQADPVPANTFNGQIEVPAGHLLQLEARLWSNGIALPTSNLTAHILAPHDRPHRDLLAWRILSVGEPGNRGAGWNLTLAGGSNPLLYPPPQGAERPDWQLAKFPAAMEIPTGASRTVQLLRGSGLAADGSSVPWEVTLDLQLVRPAGGSFHNESSLVGPGLKAPVRVTVVAGGPVVDSSSASEVVVEAVAPPRENFIVTCTVLSNGVPVVSGRDLRAKLWPPNARAANRYTVRWQATEATDAIAPWEIVVQEQPSDRIAARLRPSDLPRVGWTACAETADAGSRKVTHEARTYEVARARQPSGGGNAGAADWSVRVQLQSQPPQPTESRRGMEVDFVLPANQVAVFEVVTRSNGVVVPVSGLAAYHVNGTGEPYKGRFLWADDPDDLDSLTALPRWSFGIVSGDDRTIETGLGVPTPPSSYAGWLTMWTELKPGEERLEGLTATDSARPSYGLRVRTQSFLARPGLRFHGSGFGTNWMNEAESSMEPEGK